MKKEVTASGKTILEAKENARLALGASELDDVTYEILHAGSKGIFGIIAVKPAMVKASMETPDAAPKRERREHRRGGEHHKGNVPKAEQAAQAEAPAQKSEDKPARKRSRGGKRKVEKASAVFESELTFTKKEVNPGEDKAYDFVCRLVENLGLEANVELLTCDDGTRRINIDGGTASVLIGHHGDTLDAVQYLANLASAQRNENGERDRSRVTVNIEGYRAKREETLRTLARSMAAKAVRTGRSVTLEPMTPYERRIIHSEIQSIDGVGTNSIGSENNRKVVIFLTEKSAPAEAKVEEEIVDTVEVATEAVEATEE